MIDIRNLTYAIGGRVLLDNISFYIPNNNIVGIVGANGCGKSTLFRLILKEIFPESGEIIIPQRERIVSIQQEIHDFSEKLIDFVLRADHQLTTLRQESEAEQDGFKLAEIFEQIEKIDGFNAEVRAATILCGLGFTNQDLQKPLKEFSGGWQIRAAIAKTLFAPSEILLLDEPTNHLDFETVFWLQSHLKKIHTQKTILIVSHDRTLLNKLCDQILHLPSGNLYSGNYDTFVETRANQQLALKKQIEKQEATREHLQSFVDRFRYKASKAKQAQSRLKMLEKMQKLPQLDRDYTVKFSFPNPKIVDKELIRIKEGVAGYGDKVVLRGLNLRIGKEDRIALLGANGNGKSTLVKVLSGVLPLLSGQITFAKKLHTAYFLQQLADQLDFKKTPLEILSEVLPDSNETTVRAQLARFGLTQQKSETLVQNLSGGEKTRLLLAIITRHAPHILILDEPTNHLDIEAKDALIDALNDYQGAVVLVSHDFHVIESVCEQLFLIREHQCKPFDGDLDDYVRIVLEDKKEIKSSQKNNTKKLSPTQTKHKEQLEKHLLQVETELKSLRLQQKDLENRLNDAYDANLLTDLTKLLQQIETAEQSWLSLSEEFEGLDH